MLKKVIVYPFFVLFVSTCILFVGCEKKSDSNQDEQQDAASTTSEQSIGSSDDQHDSSDSGTIDSQDEWEDDFEARYLDEPNILYTQEEIAKAQEIVEFEIIYPLPMPFGLLLESVGSFMSSEVEPDYVELRYHLNLENLTVIQSTDGQFSVAYWFDIYEQQKSQYDQTIYDCENQVNTYTWPEDCEDLADRADGDLDLRELDTSYTIYMLAVRELRGIDYGEDVDDKWRLYVLFEANGVHFTIRDESTGTYDEVVDRVPRLEEIAEAFIVAAQIK